MDAGKTKPQLNNRGTNTDRRFTADYSSSWQLIRHPCKSPGFCHAARWGRGSQRQVHLIQLEPEAAAGNVSSSPPAPRPLTHHQSASGSTSSRCTSRSRPPSALAPAPRRPCRGAAPRSWPCWSGCGPWRSCTRCGPVGRAGRQRGQLEQAAMDISGRSCCPPSAVRFPPELTAAGLEPTALLTSGVQMRLTFS